MPPALRFALIVGWPLALAAICWGTERVYRKANKRSLPRAVAPAIPGGVLLAVLSSLSFLSSDWREFLGATIVVSMLFLVTASMWLAWRIATQPASPQPARLDESKAGISVHSSGERPSAREVLHAIRSAPKAGGELSQAEAGSGAVSLEADPNGRLSPSKRQT